MDDLSSENVYAFTDDVSEFDFFEFRRSGGWSSLRE